MTLLAKLINAHPMAVCLGDTYPSNRYDLICGCGSKVSECEFWLTIKRRVSTTTNGPHLLPLTPKALGRSADRILFRMFPIATLEYFVPRAAKHAFISGFTKFVEAIYDVSDGKPEVYVDGVKSIGRVRALLAAGEPIDGIIHLLRDPIDYTVSATKHVKGSHLALAKQAYIWRRQHRAIERLGSRAPYCRIHYEDLCASPDAALARIFAFLGLPHTTLDELRRSDKEPWHFIGNSSLFEFDWTLKRKNYDIGKSDRRLIERIAIGSRGYHVEAGSKELV